MMAPLLLRLVHLSVVASTAVAFENVQVGDKTPAFTLTSHTGTSISDASELRGQSNMIAFVRRDHEYSDRMLKALGTLYEEWHKEGLNVLAVCSGEESREGLQEMAKRLGLAFPLLLDLDRALYGQYGVIVAPCVGFMDDSGVLKFYYAGYRRGFPQVAKANVEFLLGRISASEREERTEARKAPPITTNPAGMRYRMGMNMLKRGDSEGGKAELLEAWQSEPPLVAAGVELGFLLLRKREDAEALTILSEALELVPDNTRALGGKGVALLRMGQAGGQELVEQALTRETSEPLLYYELGLWHEDKGALEKAIQYFKRALQLVLEPDEHKENARN